MCMKKFALLVCIVLVSDCFVLSAQDVVFIRAIDSVNAKLKRWAEPGNVVYITATENGNVNIVNRGEQYHRFNLFDLANAKNDDAGKKNGIELLTCEEKAHAPLTFINFYTINEQVAFIRLSCETPAAELENMYKAFMHLKSLCRKS